MHRKLIEAAKNFQKDAKFVLESVPDLYLILSPELNIVAVSDEYLKVTMLKRDEILWQSIFDIMPNNPSDVQADWQKNLSESLNQVLKNKSPDTIPVQKYDIRLPISTGSDFAARYWSILNSPVLNQDGNINYIIHRVDDITDFVHQYQNNQVNILDTLQTREGMIATQIFKRMQDIQDLNKKLQEHENYNNAFLSAVPDAMLLINHEGDIIFVNQQVENLFGYRKDELLGEKVEILIPEPYAERHPQHRIEYFKSPRVRPMGVGMELRAKRKNGEIFPVEISLSPLQTSEESAAIAIIRDITRTAEQGKLLQESESSLRQLYEKVENEKQILEESNQKMLLITKLSETLLVCNNIKEVIEAISEFINKILDFSEGVLYIMDATQKNLDQKSIWGKTKHLANVTIDDCWALRRNSIYYHNVDQPSLPCEHIRQISHNKQSYVCVPLTGGSEIYGLISILTSDPLFLKNRQNLIPIISETIALSIANIKLKEILRFHSLRDPLTGLLNRRFLEEYLNKELSQASRTNTPIVYILFDIDEFKTINDVNGHEIGDLVLSEIGSLLLSLIRKGDVACRLGGEEFLCILPGCDLKNGRNHAEKFRKAISRLSVSQQRISITVSLGVSIYPQDGLSNEQLIDAADKALYDAKNKGKNRTVLFSDIKKLN
jgi:diguanylate cyclase (GGDEF)-like protein/PAS domain S-box-containing protein